MIWKERREQRVFVQYVLFLAMIFSSFIYLCVFRSSFLFLLGNSLLLLLFSYFRWPKKHLIRINSHQTILITTEETFLSIDVRVVGTSILVDFSLPFALHGGKWITCHMKTHRWSSDSSTQWWITRGRSSLIGDIKATGCRRTPRDTISKHPVRYFSFFFCLIIVSALLLTHFTRYLRCWLLKQQPRSVNICSSAQHFFCSLQQWDEVSVASRYYHFCATIMSGCFDLRKRWDNLVGVPEKEAVDTIRRDGNASEFSFFLHFTDEISLSLCLFFLFTKNRRTQYWSGGWWNPSGRCSHQEWSCSSDLRWEQTREISPVAPRLKLNQHY